MTRRHLLHLLRQRRHPHHHHNLALRLTSLRLSRHYRMVLLVDVQHHLQLKSA